MKGMKTITLPWTTFEEMLDDRRAYCSDVFGWDCPDFVWDSYMNYLKDSDNIADADPKILVDNMLVNGNWCDFDSYKRKGESDKEFYSREKETAMYISLEEELVIYSFYV